MPQQRDDFCARASRRTWKVSTLAARHLHMAAPGKIPHSLGSPTPSILIPRDKMILQPNILGNKESRQPLKMRPSSYRQSSLKSPRAGIGIVLLSNDVMAFSLFQ
jgi:hypothetical protein